MVLMDVMTIVNSATNLALYCSVGSEGANNTRGKAKLTRDVGEIGDLGQTLEGDVLELADFEEAAVEGVDDVGHEDEAEGDPVEEAEEGLERGADEGGLIGHLQDFLAELEDLGELVAHARLEVLGLLHGELFGGVIEDFLGQQFELDGRSDVGWREGERTKGKTDDDHVIFAEGEGGLGRSDDLGDEIRPGLPIVFEDLGRSGIILKGVTEKERPGRERG